jgi:hypothetical protein
LKDWVVVKFRSIFSLLRVERFVGKKYSEFEKLVKIAMLVHSLKSFFGSMSFASRATLCSVERKLVFFIVWIWAEIPQKKSGN